MVWTVIFPNTVIISASEMCVEWVGYHGKTGILSGR